MINVTRKIVGIVLVTGISIAGAEEFHPISSIGSSTAATDLFPVSQLIQGPGVGFDASEPHESAGAFQNTLWVTDACGSQCDYFESFAPPVLTIDLGSDRDLREISIWGYDDTNDNGGREFRLRFATTADGVGGFGTGVTFAPIFTAANETLSRQSFAFGRIVRARYVEVTITENFYLPPPDFRGGDRVGLGEIAFAVPPVTDENVLVTSPRDFAIAVGLKGEPMLTNSLDLVGNLWSSELDPATGDIYFSVPTEGKIVKANVLDNPMILTDFVTVPGAVFHGLALDSANKRLYALNSATDRVEGYLLSSGGASQTIGQNFVRPNEIVYDPSRDWLVFTDSGLDKVFVFNTSGDLLHELSHTSTVGAWGVAIDPVNGDVLYSSHDLGQIWRWTAGTLTPALEQDGLLGPRGLGYDKWGRLYCVESGRAQISTFEVLPLTSYLQNTVSGIGFGARDIQVFARNDLDEDFLPDDWEISVMNPGLKYGDDPDFDRTVVGVEAALGGSVTGGPDSEGFHFVVDSEGMLELTHQALKRSDFNYTVFLSDDLSIWEPIDSLAVVSSEAGLYDSWRYVIDPDSEGFPEADKLFLRVEIDPIER